jgi:valyl-tRNA synthetase
MPFVTEEIYQIFNEGSICVAPWPTVLSFDKDVKRLELVDVLLNIITAVRNIRAEKNVPLSKKINVLIETKEVEVQAFLHDHLSYLARFLNFDHLEIKEDIDKNNVISAVIERAIIVIPAENLINIEEELARLEKEKVRLEKEVERSTKMLGNPSFREKAPADKVAAEEEKLAKYQIQLTEVIRLIEDLKKKWVNDYVFRNNDRILEFC